jgi:chromosome segregation and condensation protein ScpB
MRGADMNKDMENAKRLASALILNADNTDLKKIAKILNYDRDQLEKDVKSLYKVLLNDN